MKICWDNLPGFYLSKHGNFRKNSTPYHEEICLYCGEFCLTRKKAGFCDKVCSAKFRFENNIISNKGKDNPNYKDGRSLCKDYRHEWYKANETECKEVSRKWRKNNKHKLAEKSARRRALKLKQTPKVIDKDRINQLYFICERLNFAAGRTSFHIDHTMPLALGGLHHEDNLRILNASDNMAAGRKIRKMKQALGGLR